MQLDCVWSTLHKVSAQALVELMGQVGAMSFPKKVTFHYGPGVTGGRGNGEFHTETFANFCRANGNLSREQGRDLLLKWERERAIVRRDDGAFEVRKIKPRQK